MSASTTRTLFETVDRSPPLRLRLRERTYRDSPTVIILLEERREQGWTRVGTVELGSGPTAFRGRCAQKIVAEWYRTRFHASGARVRVGRRLRKQSDSDTLELELVLEEQREAVLGFRRHTEHGWTLVDQWAFEEPGGEQR